MKWTTEISPLLKEYELRKTPIIATVNKFDEKSAKKLKNKKHILGGKGANLGEMGRLGLPVPPGFTISTSVCDLSLIHI